MAEYGQYEKLERTSSENQDLSTSLGTINEEDHPEGVEYSHHMRGTVGYINRHKYLFSIGIGVLLLIATGLIVLVVLALPKPEMNKGRVMNLLAFENDPTLHFPNPPQPDGNLTEFTTFCGNTPRIARSRGCLFDVMSFAWLPAPCVDVEMMERYISERTWEWYIDYDMTKKASLDMVREGEYKWMFSTQAFHIAHCLYTWEKQKRFLFAEKREDEKWVDQGSFGPGHTAHCIDYILKRHVKPNKVSTIWNGIAGCRAVDDVGTL